MRVIVEEYNPIWAEQFQEVKSQLEKFLEGVNFVSIEHVGSTSVPGMAAKPILDIDIVVTAANLDPTKKALTENGGRDASVREAYGRRKLELAQRDWADVDEYCEAKNEILQYVLERAGMEKHDLDEIRQRNIATYRDSSPNNGILRKILKDGGG